MSSLDRMDELDELFGEEMEDSSMEISNLTSEIKHNEIETTVEELRITSEITLPSVQKLSSQGMIPYILKLPGFIACKRDNFEGESTLKDELIETEFCDYGDLLRAKSTVRNRIVSGGGEVESNSRLNRWSDGTWTLQIGLEHFEVLPQTFSADENNILCVRHQKEECLEGVGKLANKLTVRPFTDSQGGHRKYLALAEATGKGMKKVKVRVATTIADPEKEKRGLVKIQQDRIKARRKLDAKRRNLEQKSFDRVGKEGLSARFLEADEDEEDDDDEGLDQDEYDADFIDDGEIIEPEDEEEEESEQEDKEQNSKNLKNSENRSRTSRLIFDDDDDDEE